MSGPTGRLRAFVLRALLLSAISLLLLFVVEGACSYLLVIRQINQNLAQPFYGRVLHDPDLGWVNRPSTFIKDGCGVHRNVTINSGGIRALREYSPKEPPNTLRIAAFGDSFTFGDEAGDTETWPYQLESALPNTEVLNFGVSAYGVDQMYLSSKTQKQYDYSVQIVAFIAGDFNRMRLSFFGGSRKPVLELKDGKLVHEKLPDPNPKGAYHSIRAIKLALRDLAFLRLVFGVLPGLDRARSVEVKQEGKELEELQRAVLTEMQDSAKENGRLLVLVFLPDVASLFGNEVRPIRRRVADIAKEQHIIFFDLVDEAVRLRPSMLAKFYVRELAGGHLTTAGSSWVARTLADKLRSNEAFMSLYTRGGTR